MCHSGHPPAPRFDVNEDVLDALRSSTPYIVDSPAERKIKTLLQHAKKVQTCDPNTPICNANTRHNLAITESLAIIFKTQQLLAQCRQPT